MTNRKNNAFRKMKWAMLSISLLGLAGCSGGMPSISDMNPFKKEEPKLPGQRISVLSAQSNTNTSLGSTTGSPVSLPGPVQNASWEQPGGSQSNALGHLSYSGALKTIWSSSAGEGSSSDGHLTSSPIVYQGKIFTMDAEGKVRAFSAGNGKKIWEASTKPEGEDESEGYGGGLAIDNGRLFAATGFGNVVGFNISNGKKLWEKKIGVPVRSSPTASQNRLFVVSTEGKLFCLSGIDGAELWNVRGLPESASLLSNTSPAVSSNVVIVPFPSGEVGAYNIKDGSTLWTESLTRRSRGAAFSAFNTAASPSIVSSTVFAVSHSGRMIAADLSSGNRKWDMNIASNQKPYIAGNTVFLVDVTGKLVALSKSDGSRRWTLELPKSGTWSGPVVAGNRVWVVSSKGLLIGAGAASGKVQSKRDLGTRVYIPPIIAQNKMFIYTDKARLMALN